MSSAGDDGELSERHARRRSPLIYLVILAVLVAGMVWSMSRHAAASKAVTEEIDLDAVIGPELPPDALRFAASRGGDQHMRQAQVEIAVPMDADPSRLAHAVADRVTAAVRQLDEWDFPSDGSEGASRRRCW